MIAVIIAPAMAPATKLPITTPTINAVSTVDWAMHAGQPATEQNLQHVR